MGRQEIRNEAGLDSLKLPYEDGPDPRRAVARWQPLLQMPSILLKLCYQTLQVSAYKRQRQVHRTSSRSWRPFPKVDEVSHCRVSVFIVIQVVGLTFMGGQSFYAKPSLHPVRQE